MNILILGHGAWGGAIGGVVERLGHRAAFVGHADPAWPAVKPDYILVALPVQHVRETLEHFPPPGVPVLSLSKGLEIIENLRGHTSGYAIPQYVIDGPGGGGKIPINPNYVVAQTPDSIVLRNYKGDIYEYPEVAPADKTAPQPTPIYRHLEFLDPIEEREEITSRSWRAGRRD